MDVQAAKEKAIRFNPILTPALKPGS